MTARDDLAAAIEANQDSLATADRLIRSYADSYDALPSQICRWVQLMDPDALREKSWILRSLGAEGRGPYQDARSDARFTELYSGWTGDGFDALALRWEGGEASFTSYLGHLQAINADHVAQIDTFLDDIEQVQIDCTNTLTSDIAGVELALAELDTFWENVWFGAGWGGSGGSIIGGAIGGSAGIVTGPGSAITAAVGSGIGLVAGAIVGGIIGGLFSTGTEDIEREFVETTLIDFRLSGVFSAANGLMISSAPESLDALSYARFSPYAEAEISGDFVDIED